MFVSHAQGVDASFSMTNVVECVNGSCAFFSPLIQVFYERSNEPYVQLI
jgi:hypothetical protein